MWQHEIHLKPIIRWLWVWSIFGPGLGRHKFQGNQAATGQWKDNWWNNRLLFCGRAPKVCYKKHYCTYVWHDDDPLHCRLGPGANLFLFLAECIKTFLSKHNISSEESLPLGFTFSFPMTQTALDCGLLVNWTKVTTLLLKKASHLSHCRVSTALEWWVRMWWLCWSMLSPEWEWQMWRWWPYWMTPLALLWLAPTTIPTPPLVTLELFVHLAILIIWRSHSWHWDKCFLHRGCQAGV